MDNFFRQQKSTTQRPSGLLASQQILNGILHWLTGLVQLTEEEQRNAGIYLDDQPLQEIAVQNDDCNNQSSHLDDKEKT